MARNKIEVAALNIAANPHPNGVYVRMLDEGARYLIKVRGSDYGKITKPAPSEDRDGLVVGRILVWTEIDFNGPWLDLEGEETLSDALKDAISIPATARPNYRVFSYAFDVGRHRLYFETTNEFGEHFGPTSAKRMFTRLLSRDLRGVDFPETEVTVVPVDGAISRILDLPGLRTLQIRVVLPNADEADPAATQRVFQRLQAAKAKQLDEIYVKQARVPRLHATEEIRETAEVAATNGFVVGRARVNGASTELSTKELPRRESVSMEAGHSFVSRLLATIGLF